MEEAPSQKPEHAPQPQTAIHQQSSMLRPPMPVTSQKLSKMEDVTQSPQQPPATHSPQTSIPVSQSPTSSTPMQASSQPPVTSPLPKKQSQGAGSPHRASSWKASPTTNSIARGDAPTISSPIKSADNSPNKSEPSMRQKIS